MNGLGDAGGLSANGMVDETDDEGWSDVAAGWSRYWGGFAAPAHEALLSAAGIGPGTRVLDVGCGGGEFLTALREVGAEVVGVDPSAGMRAIAAAAGHEVHSGDAEHLPFADDTFDVVTAVNALQFAHDTTAALDEFARVLRPGGRIAVAVWAEGARNDLDGIEAAVAAADETERLPDDLLRLDGGLQTAFHVAGLRATASGIVDVPWRAVDDDTLVRGVLLGEDEAFLDEMRPVVVEAAARFRVGDGYLLRNAFRWVVGRAPATPDAAASAPR